MKKILQSERGQTSTEMLVIGGVTAAILIGVLIAFRGQVGSAFGALGGCISAAAGGSGQCGGGGGAPAASASTTQQAQQLPGIFGSAGGAVAGGAGAPGGAGGSGVPSAPGGAGGAGGSGVPGAPGGASGSGGSGPLGPGGNGGAGGPLTGPVGSGLPGAPTGPLGPGANAGAGGPLTGSVMGGLPNGAPPFVPTGPPGTMTGPLITLPPKGSVPPGSGATLGTSLTAWGELFGDGIDTAGITAINFGSGPPTSLVAPLYGNWYGAGWSGGSRDPNRIGPMPPTDWLDALGQKHDFGYEIAEEMGKKYGDFEKFRLMALADEIAARDAAMLPDDPRDWVPVPVDIEEARRNRDRLMVGFSQAHNNYLKYEALRAASQNPFGPLAGAIPWSGLGEKGFEAEEQRRVDAWNRDFLRRQAERARK